MIKNLGRRGGWQHSKAWKKKMSLRMSGNTYGKGGRGRKFTDEHRLKLSEAAKKRVAAGNHNNYKGGITEKNKKIRCGVRFKLWREKVFKRDDYACRECGTRSRKGLGKTVELHPHHIKSFSEFPKLRFVVSNGLTLCADCHKKTDSWARPNLSGEVKK